MAEDCTVWTLVDGDLKERPWTGRDRLSQIGSRRTKGSLIAAGSSPSVLKVKSA